MDHGVSDDHARSLVTRVLHWADRPDLVAGLLKKSPGVEPRDLFFAYAGVGAFDAQASTAAVVSRAHPSHQHTWWIITSTMLQARAAAARYCSSFISSAMTGRERRRRTTTPKSADQDQDQEQQDNKEKEDLYQEVQRYVTLAQRLIERAPPQSAQELDLQVALLEATGSDEAALALLESSPLVAQHDVRRERVIEVLLRLGRAVAARVLLEESLRERPDDWMAWAQWVACVVPWRGSCRVEDIYRSPGGCASFVGPVRIVLRRHEPRKPGVGEDVDARRDHEGEGDDDAYPTDAPPYKEEASLDATLFLEECRQKLEEAEAPLPTLRGVSLADVALAQREARTGWHRPEPAESAEFYMTDPAGSDLQEDSMSSKKNVGLMAALLRHLLVLGSLGSTPRDMWSYFADLSYPERRAWMVAAERAVAEDEARVRRMMTAAEIASKVRVAAWSKCQRRRVALASIAYDLGRAGILPPDRSFTRNGAWEFEAAGANDRDKDQDKESDYDRRSDHGPVKKEAGDVEVEAALVPLAWRSRHAAAQYAMRLYQSFAADTQGRDPREQGPADELVLVAVGHLVFGGQEAAEEVKMMEEENGTGHLLHPHPGGSFSASDIAWREVGIVSALVTLEAAIVYRPHHAGYRIAASLLASRLGAKAVAESHVAAMDLKHVQMDSVASHLAVPFLTRLGGFPASSSASSPSTYPSLPTVVTDGVHFYENHAGSHPESLQLTFERGSYAKSIEFVDFRERVAQSFAKGVYRFAQGRWRWREGALGNEASWRDGLAVAAESISGLVNVVERSGGGSSRRPRETTSTNNHKKNKNKNKNKDETTGAGMGTATTTATCITAATTPEDHPDPTVLSPFVFNLDLTTRPTWAPPGVDERHGQSYDVDTLVTTSNEDHDLTLTKGGARIGIVTYDPSASVDAWWLRVGSLDAAVGSEAGGRFRRAMSMDIRRDAQRVADWHALLREEDLGANPFPRPFPGPEGEEEEATSRDEGAGRKEELAYVLRQIQAWAMVDITATASATDTTTTAASPSGHPGHDETAHALRATSLRLEHHLRVAGYVLRGFFGTRQGNLNDHETSETSASPIVISIRHVEQALSRLTHVIETWAGLVAIHVTTEASATSDTFSSLIRRGMTGSSLAIIYVASMETVATLRHALGIWGGWSGLPRGKKRGQGRAQALAASTDPEKKEPKDHQEGEDPAECSEAEEKRLHAALWRCAHRSSIALVGASDRLERLAKKFGREGAKGVVGLMVSVGVDIEGLWGGGEGVEKARTMALRVMESVTKGGAMGAEEAARVLRGHARALDAL